MSSERRRHSRSRSRSNEAIDVSKYPLKLTIPQKHVPHFSDTELILRIRSEAGPVTLALNQSLDIPDFPDGIIKIQEGTLSQKTSALKLVSSK